MSTYADLYDVTSEGDVVLRIHTQPGAGQSAVVGRHGGALKVRVAAPPVDGRANALLTDVVARTLGVAASQVELVGGASSRDKRVKVTGVTPELVDAALSRTLAGASGRGATPRR